MTTLVKIAAAAALAATLSAPVNAKTIKMTVVSAAPPIVTHVKVTKQFFIPEVNRRIKQSGEDFHIEWTEAYSSTLAKFSEVFETVEEGIAQLGVILKTFEPSKLPLEQYAHRTPFAGHSVEQMLTIDRNVRAKVPALNKTYAQFNQVYLDSAGGHSMQLFTTFPVRTVADIKGRKIGTSGAMGSWLRGTGAVAVSAAMSNSYTDIKNGLYDGYTINATLAFPYKTYEVARYMTRAHFGVTAGIGLTVNKATWDDMPRFARRIFTDVAREWGAGNARTDNARFAKFVAIMKKKGLKIADMSYDERRRWAMMMPNISREWADRLEKKGLPGRAVLTAYMDELRALKVTIPRHWDRE